MTDLSVTTFGDECGVQLLLSYLRKGADAPIQENWTGYSACLDPKWTVAEREARLTDDGKATPISGDGTARWDHWRATGRLPRYADIPSKAPAGVLF
ncbi:hypothetical protein QFZ79_002926 [Arthrobacter sp. V4I6]|uniref:hypothetical protein n=1 Tax=Arthrobacter sp. V4I6 TaxID=3042281 RepID=UPI002783C417|nr:hypothetical protein [Arthrobacter sp. V4I6]MDQ0854815.1 hypothetical protein [Arthrobacter sp. V4I6]